jgi:hypothetical protein
VSKISTTAAAKAIGDTLLEAARAANADVAGGEYARVVGHLEHLVAYLVVGTPAERRAARQQVTEMIAKATGAA